MDPSALVLRVHLSPDMVFGVPYPANTATDCAAQHAEAVGPFANTAAPSLEQSPDIAVSWESFISTAVLSGASVQFDPESAASTLLGGRRRHALGNGGREADWAGWVIDPCEEGALEPSKKSTDDAVLIAPFGFAAIAHALRLSLKNLGFLFGFAVDAIEGDDLERFVEETGVLVLCGSK